MKILHCIEKEAWEKMKEEKYPGKKSFYPLLVYRIFLESFPSF